MRDPVLAGILSLIVPGVGHLYNGQFLAGALWLMALVTIIPGFWIGTGGILGLPRADRVLGQGNARPPHRLGDEQPPPLRARAAQGRPRLRRLRAGRLGRRPTLQRRAVAATGRAVAPLQPPPRARHRARARREAEARAPPPHAPPHRVRSDREGTARHARIPHARLRRPPRTPPRPNPRGKGRTGKRVKKGRG